MRSTTVGSVITETTFISEPQRGRTRGSTSKDRRSYCTSCHRSGGAVLRRFRGGRILARGARLDPLRLLDGIVHPAALVAAVRSRKAGCLPPYAHLGEADAESGRHLGGRELSRLDQVVAVALQPVAARPLAGAACGLTKARGRANVGP